MAAGYFALRGFDAQLDISQQTAEADREIVRINTIGFKGGEYAITDVYQAQLLVQTAEAQIITLQQSIQQTENQLSILLGRNPGPIVRGLNLVDQPHLPELPAGLPSALLQRRPDVQQAEQALVAANANVGVAKANFFPQLSLTGSFGAQSTALSSFLQGPATFWAVGGGIVQPLLRGRQDHQWLQARLGATRPSGVVLQANRAAGFRGCFQQPRGLSPIQGSTAIKLQEQTATYKETARLANVRFMGGYTSFLEVLYTEQQYFTSELSLTQAWYAEMQNYAQLYQALGGGWEQ